MRRSQDTDGGYKEDMRTTTGTISLKYEPTAMAISLCVEPLIANSRIHTRLAKNLGKMIRRVYKRIEGNETTHISEVIPDNDWRCRETASSAWDPPREEQDVPRGLGKA